MPDQRTVEKPQLAAVRTQNVPLYVLPLLWLAVLGVHGRGLFGQFVYDDLIMIVRNPLIADPGRWVELVTSPFWAFSSTASEDVGYWRPLTSSVFALGQSLGNGAPLPFHVLSLLLHGLAVSAAFFLALHLTNGLWCAALTALLFGLHPIQVESVAWITAINEPLYGALALGALVSYLRWRRRGSAGIPLLAALSFALALGAKESAIAVLPLILLMDLVRPRTEGDGEGWSGGLHSPSRAWGPFLAVFLFYCGARVFIFASPWAGFDLVSTHFKVSAARLLLLRAEFLGGGIELLAWPGTASLFRAFRPHVDLGDGAVLRALGAIAVLLAAVLWALRRRDRVLLAALAFIPVSVAPAWIAIESIGRFPVSDRFFYLAAFGFALLVPVLLQRALSWNLALPVCAGIAGFWGYESFERTGTWHDEESLFRASAEASPESPYALWGLGRVLLQRYRESNEPRYLAEAFEAYLAGQQLLQASKAQETRIFATSRDFLQMNLGLGWCYLFEDELSGYRNYSTAIAVWEELEREAVRALEEREQAAESGLEITGDRVELEQIYTAIGVGYTLAGKPVEAEAALKKALAYNREYPEAYQNMGRLFARKEEWRLAQEYFERALELRPNHYEDRLLLAQARHSGGDKRGAEKLAFELIDSPYERPEPFVILATLRLEEGNTSEALKWLDRALDSNGNYGYAWYLKGKALRQREAAQEAILAFRKAVELMPDNFEAHYDFASYLLESGSDEAALPILIRAYGLCRDEGLVLRMRAILPQMPFESPSDLFQLADIDRRRGQLDLAESWLDAALTLDPRHGDSLFMKGRLLRERGRNDEALELMRQGLEQLGDSFVAHSELGLFLADLGQLQEAVGLLEASLELPAPKSWAAETFEATLAKTRERLKQLRLELEKAGPGLPPG